MQPILRAILIIISATIFFITLELIRRGRLREEHSLIWLISSAIVFFFSVFPGSGRFVAQLLQIEYTPALFFMLGIGLIIVMQMLHSMMISRMTGRNRDLAQELAILELRLVDFADQMIIQGAGQLQDLPVGALESLRRSFAGISDQRALLQKALELSLEHAGAAGGSVLVLDRNQDLVDVTVTDPRASGPTDLSEFKQTLTGGLAGWVIENRNGALVTSTQEDPRWLKRTWDLHKGRARSAVSAPLVVNGRVLAVFTLVAPSGKLGETHLAFLMALSYLVSKPYADILGRASSEHAGAASRIDGLARQVDEPFHQDQPMGD
jgi:hypothetical protein